MAVALKLTGSHRLEQEVHVNSQPYQQLALEYSGPPIPVHPIPEHVKPAIYLRYINIIPIHVQELHCPFLPQHQPPSAEATSPQTQPPLDFLPHFCSVLPPKANNGLSNMTADL